MYKVYTIQVTVMVAVWGVKLRILLTKDNFLPFLRHSHWTNNIQKCSFLCILQSTSNCVQLVKIWSFCVQYYRSYSHPKLLKNYTLAENCTKSHLHGPFIDAHISETTEDIILKFCTLPYEYMMSTYCKFHQILRWSSWSHLLNWHGMTPKSKQHNWS